MRHHGSRPIRRTGSCRSAAANRLASCGLKVGQFRLWLVVLALGDERRDGEIARHVQRGAAHIEQAIDANVDLLRVWGGGIYEKEIFYDLCDQEGILVWQDMMFAGSLYPTNNLDFTNSVYKEIAQKSKVKVKFKV